jgi:AcrR family transcriptional regulator
VTSSASTRDRILTATGELFRRKGYNGTSLKEVTVAAEAPFGSLYHSFPGGKEELAEAVILGSGAAYQELFETIYDAAADPASAIGDFFDGAAAVLEETGYIDACPIGTVALEVASTNDRLRRATDTVFGWWVAAAQERLEAGGVPGAEAGQLATALVAAVEGGFMLSRAARSAEPMRATGRVMEAAVAAALATVPTGSTAGVPGDRT